MSLDRGLWVFRSIYDNPKIAYRSGHLMMEISKQAIRQAKFQNSAFAIVVSANKFIATIRNAEKCRCYKRRNQFDRAKVDRS